jgi:hypothetical protein
MTAFLVHFGVDTCFRLQVLRRAGYEIAECDSLEMLPRALASHPDAVVIEDDPAAMTERAIALTRLQSGVPLVLFAAEPCLTKVAVDLIIPAFTTPDQWLEEIRALIARTHEAIAQLEPSAPEKKKPGRYEIEIRRQSSA